MTGRAPAEGDRVVVRHLLPTGMATDVIGILVSAGDPLVVDAGDRTVAVPRDTVVVCKTIPPRPIRNREIRSLTRARARSRPSLETAEVDGWLCRTGRGIAGLRANSAAPLNPAARLDDLDRVRAWYTERGLPLRLMWVDRLAARPAPALDRRLAVFTSAVADVAAESVRVSWSAAPSAAWLALQSGAAADAAWAAAVVGGARFGLLDDGAGPAAAVRLSLTHDGDDPAAGELWAGIGSLVVAPDRRRRGLGTELVRSLATVAGEAGAARCYLEVRDGNDAGRALYAGLGFAEHHRYGYWTEPAGT